MQVDIYLSPSAEHLRIGYRTDHVEHPDDLYLIDMTLQALAFKQFEIKLPSAVDQLQIYQNSRSQVELVVFSNGRFEIRITSD